ncbi:MAG: hypothetical protein ACTTJ9_09935 [Segatella oris]|uniref:hypothetical protein n=1 Tax=Segatella oris TaxID=28135 RepID=UPI003FA2DB7C
MQATSEKRKKQPVARSFSSKITKNSVSLASDERKTMKTVRRSCFFFENCQKQRFACKRRAKNDENSPSLVFFLQKLPKTAFRLQAMSEKREKSCFGESRSLKIPENKLSGSPEARKI